MTAATERGSCDSDLAIQLKQVLNTNLQPVNYSCNCFTLKQLAEQPNMAAARLWHIHQGGMGGYGGELIRCHGDALFFCLMASAGVEV